MKLQYLAVIFVIIMIPIFLVLSIYMDTRLDTIELQNLYTSYLNDATYDAVKTFQLNTNNNYYSSISDSKIRDIDASINTFFNSLTDNTKLTKQELQSYLPAMVYTLYDGYYIYGRRYNVLGDKVEDNQLIQKGVIKDESGTVIEMNIDTDLEDGNQYEYGIKPYVYYSCRYISGTNNFVVNYTLDNFITIYGTVNVWNEKHTAKEKQYITKSGYLIDVNAWNELDKTYKGAKIEEPEILKEYLRFNKFKPDEEEGTEHLGTIVEKKDGVYEYVIHQNRRVYFERNEKGDAINFFWYNKGRATEVQRQSIKDYVARNTVSAIEYYQKAAEFSIWVSDNIATIEGLKLGEGQNLDVNTNYRELFNMTKQDPEDPSSSFNQHRRAVIKNTIETNLIAAINSYNGNKRSYEYVMPKLEEEEWDKIVSNICVVAFMQGIPIGEKYYNNYVVVPNDKNNDLVDEDSIYLLTDDGQYHLPSCSKLIEEEKYKNGTITIQRGYKNTTFTRQTLEQNSEYYYSHVYEVEEDNKIKLVPYTACYYCIVNSGTQYNLEDIREAKNNRLKETGYDISIIRSKYLTALAREKQELYKTNLNYVEEGFE